MIGNIGIFGGFIARLLHVRKSRKPRSQSMGKEERSRDFRREGEFSILFHKWFKNRLSRPTLTATTRLIGDDEHRRYAVE